MKQTYNRVALGIVALGGALVGAAPATEEPLEAFAGGMICIIAGGTVHQRTLPKR